MQQGGNQTGGVAEESGKSPWRGGNAARASAMTEESGMHKGLPQE